MLMIQVVGRRDEFNLSRLGWLISVIEKAFGITVLLRLDRSNVAQHVIQCSNSRNVGFTSTH